MVYYLSLIKAKVVILLKLDGVDALIDALLSIKVLGSVSPTSILAGVLDSFVQPPEEVLILKARCHGISFVHFIDSVPEAKNQSGYVNILQCFITVVDRIAVGISQLVD
jgi:hypothetical protein